MVLVGSLCSLSPSGSTAPERPLVVLFVACKGTPATGQDATGTAEWTLFDFGIKLVSSGAAYWVPPAGTLQPLARLSAPDQEIPISNDIHAITAIAVR